MKHEGYSWSAPNADVDDFIQRLGERENSRYRAAEKELRRRMLDAIPALLAGMRRETERVTVLRRKSLRRCAGVSVVLFAVVAYIQHTYGSSAFGGALWWTAVGLADLSRHVSSFNELSFRREGILRILNDCDDRSILGPMAELLENRFLDPSPALIRLLPTLRASDADMLTPHQRLCLYRRLRSREYRRSRAAKAEELALAILKALEQIGEPEAIPYVEHMAASAKAAQLRQAAEDCLPYLEKRSAERRETETLLRASAPQAAFEELLRAAQANAETPAHQLLRPGTKDD